MNARVNRGFTMVEALVALLVLSIGLLGIAALQMTGLRANMGAGFRSQATYLAYDIIDRMRANRTEAMSGALPYNIGLGAAPGGSTTAERDLAAWKTNLATLPAGDGSVTVTALTGIVSVTVQWSEQDREPGTTPVGPITFTTQSRL